jgi:hypothetical protein
MEMFPSSRVVHKVSWLALPCCAMPVRHHPEGYLFRFVCGMDDNWQLQDNRARKHRIDQHVAERGVGAPRLYGADGRPLTGTAYEEEMLNGVDSGAFAAYFGLAPIDEGDDDYHSDDGRDTPPPGDNHRMTYEQRKQFFAADAKRNAQHIKHLFEQKRVQLYQWYMDHTTLIERSAANRAIQSNPLETVIKEMCGIGTSSLTTEVERRRFRVVLSHRLACRGFDLHIADLTRKPGSYTFDIRRRDAVHPWVYVDSDRTSYGFPVEHIEAHYVETSITVKCQNLPRGVLERMQH